MTPASLSLVERLRAGADWLETISVSNKSAQLHREAAAHIEALEKAPTDQGVSLNALLECVGDKVGTGEETYYRWSAMPSFKVVQAALEANNVASSVLAELGGGGK